MRLLTGSKREWRWIFNCLSRTTYGDVHKLGTISTTELVQGRGLSKRQIFGDLNVRKSASEWCNLSIVGEVA